MGAFSRDKGKRGEKEAANLIHDITGWAVKRRVRQLKGDSDLDVQDTPLDAWCIEVKRYAKATRSDLKAWWGQAVSEAQATGRRPVLLYRVDRDDWRAVWLHPGLDDSQSYVWTHEGGLHAWIEIVMEVDDAGRGQANDGAADLGADRADSGLTF